MSGSETGAAGTRPPRLQPTTAEELLDDEQARAIQEIAASVQRSGEELCGAAGLRPRIRRHPFVAMGLGAFLGFVGVPLVPRALLRTLAATSSAILVRVIRGP